jgi:hypothetical protein
VHDEGLACFLVFALFILPLGLIFWGVIHSSKRAQAERHERGQRVTNLLIKLSASAGNQAIRQELSTLLANAPVAQPERFGIQVGWFGRVLPALTQLSDNAADSALVEAYFYNFAFPAGSQSKVLEFLYAMLRQAVVDSRKLELFKRIAVQVLVSSLPAEARWIYDRALELVRAHSGVAASKDLALFIGRHAYAAARADRRPTLYDEQAIANDIAVQVG